MLYQIIQKCLLAFLCKLPSDWIQYLKDTFDVAEASNIEKAIAMGCLDVAIKYNSSGLSIMT